MIRRVLGWALVVLTIAALYMSWGNLYDLAIACGMPPERAVVFPVVIDVVTVVSMLLSLLGGDAESQSARVYPWIALGIFGAATIAGNALHVLTAPAGTISVNEWIAVVANSLPAVALLITTHLAAVTVYRPEAATAATALTEPATDPVVIARDTRTVDVMQLVAEGTSDRQIAERLGLSRSTVGRIRRDSLIA